MLKALFKRIIGLYMNITFRRWLKQEPTHIGWVLRKFGALQLYHLHLGET
jgi:hypothetical protein